MATTSFERFLEEKEYTNEEKVTEIHNKESFYSNDFCIESR